MSQEPISVKNSKSTNSPNFSFKAVSESPFKAAFRFGAKMLSEREMGAYEAADFLLGTPLFFKSDPVKYVDVTRTVSAGGA